MRVIICICISICIRILHICPSHVQRTTHNMKKLLLYTFARITMCIFFNSVFYWWKIIIFNWLLLFSDCWKGLAWVSNALPNWFFPQTPGSEETRSRTRKRRAPRRRICPRGRPPLQPRESLPLVLWSDTWKQYMFGKRWECKECGKAMQTEKDLSDFS